MRIEFVNCWINGHSKDVVSDGSFLGSKMKAYEETFVKLEDLHFSEIPCFFEIENEEAMSKLDYLNCFYYELNDKRLEELLHSKIDLKAKADDFIAIEISNDDEALHTYYVLSNEKYERLCK